MGDDILSATPVRKPSVAVTEVLDERLLYDSDTETAVSLNVSSSAIWELCDGGRTTREIIQELAALVGGSEEDLLADVVGAVLQLRDLGLLSLEHAAATGLVE